MRTVTPYLVIDGAEEAMKFYEKAFGARILTTLKAPDGKVMHGRLEIGDSFLFVMDANPQMGYPGPEDGKTTVSLHLDLPDVDAFFARAVEAGSRAIMPPTDMFWGDRYAQLVDPYGHRWSCGMPVKQLSEAELQAAAAEAFRQMSECPGQKVEA